MAIDVRFGYGVIQKWPDWVLLGKGERHEGIQPWIAAHYPEYDENGDVTSWGSGHYFDKLFDAVACVESYISNVRVVKLSEAELECIENLVDKEFDAFDFGTPCEVYGFGESDRSHCESCINVLKVIGDDADVIADYENRLKSAIGGKGN